MIFEVVKDKLHPHDWRVETVRDDSEGECYVAIFTGPDAERRAREYAAWKNQGAAYPRDVKPSGSLPS